MNRIQERYKKEIVPALTKEFSYSSVMQVPKIEKIVINMGIGEGSKNSKLIDQAVEELGEIAGQRPVITTAKKSIATYRTREGMPIGVKVTLRGKNMYNFLDKLISIALPRVRDFRGIPATSFDGRGNYTFGVKEELIFPEIDFDKIQKVKGMDIIIVTTANTNEEGKSLLTHIGLPFKK